MNLIDVPQQLVTGHNFVGGEKTASVTGRTLAVESPYTGTTVGEVPRSSKEDVEAAVQAASRAAESWALVPLKERTQILFRFRDLVYKHIDTISNLVSLEAGKTFDEAKAGVAKGLEVVEFALSLQNLDDGGALEVSRGVSCEVRREPLGVVAGITPFNFPAMVPMWMYPCAITLGNAFILKPSEKVPLTACFCADLLLEAGLPNGVFSVINGDREAVEGLIDHPDVKAVAFVGSSPVARAVYARAAASGKRSLSLGGAKNHLLVVPDADPEITIPGVVDSFTGCAGQRCMAASLMVAVGDVDHLIDGIVERASQIQLGTGMGAIIDRASTERLTNAVQKAKEDGVKVRVDGREASAPAGYENGFWFGPSVLDGADPSMECASKELFGPIITIVRVDTLEEALALEKNSPYGNATSVFTTSGTVACRVAEEATNGMIGVNIGVPVPREPFSFGGTKDSRFGCGDITGKAGVEFWSHLKKITSKWALQSDANWMS